ncbi:MAG: hypothetical protein WC464_03465 [Bdellovibrionales bacterium]
MHHSFFLVAAFALFTVFFSPSAAHAESVGDACPASSLGTSKLDSDKTNVIICLHTSKTVATTKWKAMTSEGPAQGQLCGLTSWSCGYVLGHSICSEGTAIQCNGQNIVTSTPSGCAISGSHGCLQTSYTYTIVCPSGYTAVTLGNNIHTCAKL